MDGSMENTQHVWDMGTHCFELGGVFNIAIFVQVERAESDEGF